MDQGKDQFGKDLPTEKDYKLTNVKPSLYALYYPDLRIIALEHGYNLVLHGSLINDFDLVAIPWANELKPVNDMLAAFCSVIGYSYSNGNPYGSIEEKPHGRTAYTVRCGGNCYMDISVLSANANT